MEILGEAGLLAVDVRRLGADLAGRVVAREHALRRAVDRAAIFGALVVDGPLAALRLAREGFGCRALAVLHLVVAPLAAADEPLGERALGDPGHEWTLRLLRVLRSV